MNHIDEHTLELFVLGAKEVRGKKKSIEAHIKKCEGCRRLVRTMTEYYSTADARLRSRPHSQSQALIRPHTEIRPAYDPYYSTIKTPVPAPFPSTFLQHVYSYAKQNPVKSVIGSFTLIVGLVLLINFALKTVLKDTNPAYTIMNVPHMALEVYNREDEMLWQLPHASIASALESEMKYKIHFTSVADLNEDGKNEVITVIPHPADNNNAKTLRAYNGEKKVVLIRQLQDSTINFLSNHYETSFYFEGIVLDDFAGSGRKEIFAAVASGRSPWYLARFNHQFQIVGEYWHFGAQKLYEADLNNDGKKEIIVCGVNQVDELQSGQFSDIAVLDPMEITGDAEAAATRGYGLEASRAEIFYIRIPESDMFKALGTKQGGPMLVSSVKEKQLKFSVGSGVPEGPYFEFIFSKEMQVQEVKYGSPDVWIHAKLKKEGKISSTLDQKYLNDLKNGVRYWDGKEWKKEVTKVRHDIAPNP
jgi:hypothetical protein